MTTNSPPVPSLAIVCYSKCWDCQFGQHSGKPHTWMDAEDIEYSKDVAWPETPEQWAALAVSHPCGCWCLKETPCPQCKGSGCHPADDEQPCPNCNGRAVLATPADTSPGRPHRDEPPLDRDVVDVHLPARDIPA